MRHELNQKAAREFADKMKELGFVVYLAKSGDYGIVTDEQGSRVMRFSFDGLTATLGGTYGPPSTTSGTGWRLDIDPFDLETKEDVEKALYARPPQWAGSGWKYFTTLDQHLKEYGASSGYQLA